MLCGGPGSGKSMRAKRLMALLPDGWVKGSGGGSAKATRIA
jgi:ABC-type dipeptide/oligopeptide/nickel transport system ATPase component